LPLQTPQQSSSLQQQPQSLLLQQPDNNDNQGNNNNNPSYKITDDKDNLIIKILAPRLKKEDLKLLVYIFDTKKILISGKYLNFNFVESNFNLEINLDGYIDTKEEAEISIVEI